MEAYDRFELLINDRIVKTPVAIASMAGIVDAAYVLERADHVGGAAFIGGYSIDAPTRGKPADGRGGGGAQRVLVRRPSRSAGP